MSALPDLVCPAGSLPKVDSPPTIQPFAEMSWLPVPVLSAQTPLTLLALPAMYAAWFRVKPAREERLAASR
jgi:hypothetical protein